MDKRARAIARNILIVFCVGISFALYAVAFEPFGAAEAAYVFAVPSILAARLVSNAGGRPAWVWSTFGFSYAAWIGILVWLRHVYEPFGFFAMLSLPLVISTLFIFPWFYALPQMLPKESDGIWASFLKILGLAGFWIILEWLRSWIFTGFPWLLLGESQWRRTAVIQTAEFGGVWIISFMLIFFNLAVAEYLRRIYAIQRNKLLTGTQTPFLRRISPEFYTALLLMLSGVWIYAWRMPHGNPAETLRVGLVQTDFAGILKWKPELGYQNLAAVKNLTLGLKKANVDVVALPEAATPPMWPIVGLDEMQSWFETLAKDLGKPIITGNMAYLNEKRASQNGAFVIEPNSGLKREYYAKRKLVPFGEYVPKWAFFMSSVVPIGALEAGVSSQPLEADIKGKDYKLGCMICYEDIFPSMGREAALNGAQILFVCTNDSWYGREGGAWQHAAHSALQAVSTRKPLIRSSNNGLSTVFDQYGRMVPSQTLKNSHGQVWDGAPGTEPEKPIEIRTPDGKLIDENTLRTKRPYPMSDNDGNIYFRGAAFADLPIYGNFDISQKTFYVRYGDWVVWLSMIFFIASILPNISRRKKHE